MPIFSITSDAAGLESVSKFQIAPQTVTVVAVLQSTAAHGRFQIALSGCPKTRNTRCSADTANMPLATAFVAVAAVIGNKFCADCFHRAESTEPQQKRRGVRVLWLPVQSRQLENERRNVVRRRGAPEQARQRPRQVAARFLGRHQHGAGKARHGKPEVDAGMLEFVDHFAGGLKLAP